jgi:sugar phosphate isomerase/epimerase
MQLGCHCYVFSEYGYDQAAQLDQIWDMIAAAGYPAIEFYGPNLQRPDWYEAVMRATERTGLRLIGGSSGGNVADPAEWDTLLAMMDEYTQKLARFGTMKCGFSATGKRVAERTDAENAHVVRAWTELLALCRSRGVELNYHTHGEPPADVQFVVDNVPKLPLGPDLDWLRFGGSDPEAFLRVNAARLVMLHARDYKLGGERTFALGDGDANYPHLKSVLTEIGFEGDFVVELAAPPSATVKRDLFECLKQSRERVRETMGL